MSTTQTPTVAQVIWSQIQVMVKMSLGMRDMVTTQDSLTFRAGPSQPKWKGTITLNGRDYYDVTFAKINRKFEIVDSWEETDVCCEDLNACLLRAERACWGC